MKEIKPWTIAEKIVDWLYKRWCKWRDCSVEEDNSLGEEIAKLDAKIDELKAQLESKPE